MTMHSAMPSGRMVRLRGGLCFLFLSISAQLLPPGVNPSSAVGGNALPHLLDRELTPDSPVSFEVEVGEAVQMHFKCLGAPADAIVTMESYQEHSSAFMTLVNPNGAPHDLGKALDSSFEGWQEDSIQTLKIEAVPSAGMRIAVFNINSLSEEAFEGVLKIRCSYTAAMDFMLWDPLLGENLCPAGDLSAYATSFEQQDDVQTFDDVNQETDAASGVHQEYQNQQSSYDQSYSSYEPNPDTKAYVENPIETTVVNPIERRTTRVANHRTASIVDRTPEEFNLNRTHFRMLFGNPSGSAHPKTSNRHLSTSNEPLLCSGHGECVNTGDCRCHTGYTGEACEHEIEELARGHYGFELNNGKYKYFKIRLPTTFRGGYLETKVKSNYPVVVLFNVNENHARDGNDGDQITTRDLPKKSYYDYSNFAQWLQHETNFKMKFPLVPLGKVGDSIMSGGMSMSDDGSLYNAGLYNLYNATPDSVSLTECPSEPASWFAHQYSAKNTNPFLCQSKEFRQCEQKCMSCILCTKKDTECNQDCGSCAICVPELQACGSSVGCETKGGYDNGNSVESSETVPHLCQECTTCLSSCAFSTDTRCKACGCCKPCLPWSVACGVFMDNDAGLLDDSNSNSSPDFNSNFVYLAVYNHHQYYSELGPTVSVKLDIDVVEDPSAKALGKHGFYERSWLAELYNPFRNIKELEGIHKESDRETEGALDQKSDSSNKEKKPIEYTQGKHFYHGTAFSYNENYVKEEVKRMPNPYAAVVNVFRDRATLVKIDNLDLKPNIRFQFTEIFGKKGLEELKNPELVILFSTISSPKTLFDFEFAAGTPSKFVTSTGEIYNEADEISFLDDSKELEHPLLYSTSDSIDIPVRIRKVKTKLVKKSNRSNTDSKSYSKSHLKSNYVQKSTVWLAIFATTDGTVKVSYSGVDTVTGLSRWMNFFFFISLMSCIFRIMFNRTNKERIRDEFEESKRHNRGYNDSDIREDYDYRDSRENYGRNHTSDSMGDDVMSESGGPGGRSSNRDRDRGNDPNSDGTVVGFLTNGFLSIVDGVRSGIETIAYPITGTVRGGASRPGFHDVDDWETGDAYGSGVVGETVSNINKPFNRTVPLDDNDPSMAGIVASRCSSFREENRRGSLLDSPDIGKGGSDNTGSLLDSAGNNSSEIKREGVHKNENSSNAEFDPYSLKLHSSEDICNTSHPGNPSRPYPRSNSFLANIPSSALDFARDPISATQQLLRGGPDAGNSDFEMGGGYGYSGYYNGHGGYEMVNSSQDYSSRGTLINEEFLRGTRVERFLERFSNWGNSNSNNSKENKSDSLVGFDPFATFNSVAETVNEQFNPFTPGPSIDLRPRDDLHSNENQRQRKGPSGNSVPKKYVKKGLNGDAASDANPDVELGDEVRENISGNGGSDSPQCGLGISLQGGLGINDRSSQGHLEDSQLDLLDAKTREDDLLELEGDLEDQKEEDLLVKNEDDLLANTESMTDDDLIIIGEISALEKSEKPKESMKTPQNPRTPTKSDNESEEPME